MNRSDFTFQMFWQNAGTVEPFLRPLTLKLESIDEARRIIEKVVGHPDIPLHSLTIISEDQAISERWYQLDGAWRRKPSERSPD
jgi:hypothetical protein